MVWIQRLLRGSFSLGSQQQPTDSYNNVISNYTFYFFVKLNKSDVLIFRFGCLSLYCFCFCTVLVVSKLVLFFVLLFFLSNFVLFVVFVRYCTIAVFHDQTITPQLDRRFIILLLTGSISTENGQGRQKFLPPKQLNSIRRNWKLISPEFLVTRPSPPQKVIRSNAFGFTNKSPGWGITKLMGQDVQVIMNHPIYF